MTTPLTHSIEQASKRLGGPFTVAFLKHHIAELPHIKVGDGTGRGGRVGFSEVHLAQIIAMFAVEPEPGSQPGDFTPLTRRRSA